MCVCVCIYIAGESEKRRYRGKRDGNRLWISSRKLTRAPREREGERKKSRLGGEAASRRSPRNYFAVNCFAFRGLMHTLPVRRRRRRWSEALPPHFAFYLGSEYVRASFASLWGCEVYSV